MKALNLISYILNGINFASYELDSFRYRAEAIGERQQVLIPRLLQNQVTRIDLLGVLKYPLLVSGLDADVDLDDDKNFKEDTTNHDISPSFYIHVAIINRKTNLIVKKVRFIITSYPSLNNEIILNPDYIYEIKCSRTVNLLTFIGKPIYLKEPIVFTDGIVKS